MAKLSIQGGKTSQSLYLFLQDSSSSTGSGLTGLAFNTASLVAYYVRPLGSATAITLATLAAVTSAWSSGGFKEVDATNMPGVYRLDIPDAAIAGAVRSVLVMIKGATNLAPLALELELTGWDNQDVVRGGLTALPNTVGGVALEASLQALITTVGAAGAGLTATATAVWAVATRLLTAGTNIVLAKGTGVTGFNDIAAVAIVSSGAITTSGGKVSGVALVDALASGERDSIADALLDRASGIETSFTPRQSFRLMLSSAVAKLSGAATATVAIRDINDTKDRITATVDASGNRTAVTTNVT